MKKIFQIVSILIAIIFITSGCGNISVGSVTVKDFDQKLRTISDISKLKKEDAKGLEKLYNINKTELEDFVLYTSKSKDNAEEILVLKVKYLSSINEVEERIKKRINTKNKDFKEISPKEYRLIKNNLMEDRQNFVIFIVSKDKTKIEKAFNKMVKS